MCTLQRVIGKHPSMAMKNLFLSSHQNSYQKKKHQKSYLYIHFSESYPESNAVLTDVLTLKIVPIILAILLELHILTFSILINLKSFLEHLKCLYN